MGAVPVSRAQSSDFPSGDNHNKHMNLLGNPPRNSGFHEVVCPLLKFEKIGLSTTAAGWTQMVPLSLMSMILRTHAS